jgi:hypothetical protein
MSDFMSHLIELYRAHPLGLLGVAAPLVTVILFVLQLTLPAKPKGGVD